MRYVAAYLLAVLGGKAQPSRDDITKILSSVGISVDEERLNHVLSALKGKKMDEILAEGREKLSAVPSGGAVAAASTGGAPATAASAAGGGDAVEAKKAEEKKKEESEEESDDDMGFGLFD